MSNSVKKVLILGGGFAGIRVALDLDKLCKKNGVKAQISLINKRNAHLFRADLYEVATAFNDEISDECMARLSKAVATPISLILKDTDVNLIIDEVIEIDAENKNVSTKKEGKIKYDYLVSALGSVSNDFGIPGMKEHSFPLKTVTDALAINCHLDQLIHDLWKREEKNKIVNIVVGGGGASGVETAAELYGSLNKLAKKYYYPRENLAINLVEAGTTLGGFDEKGTNIILKRFQKRGVKVFLEHMITAVDSKKVQTKKKNGEEDVIKSDLVIWTCGVKINDIIAKSIGAKEHRGAILVNDYLQSCKYEDIYAAGDNAYFQDPDNPGKPLPMLATTAVKQGKVIASNIFAEISGEKKTKYRHKKAAYLIPIGGKYVMWKLKGVLLRGNWIWPVRRLFSLWYFMSILPFGEAFKRWQHGSRIFVKND